MTQMTIPANQSKIEAAFWEFHREHPEVYDELVQLARDTKSQGYDRLGIGMLYEVCRWRRLMLIPAVEGGFKLNNNYRAYYARLIMKEEGDLVGVFDTRKLTVPSHVVP